MTLVEVMISTAVFVVLAAGVLGTTVMVRRSINQALVRNIAYDTAQGFLEQIKGIPFGTLQKAMNTGNAMPVFYNDITTGRQATLNLIRQTAADGPDYQYYKAPENSTTAEATSVSSRDLAAINKAMSYIPDYGLRLELNPVNDANTGTGNAILVTLRFRYKYLPSGLKATDSSALDTVGEAFRPEAAPASKEDVVYFVAPRLN